MRADVLAGRELSRLAAARPEAGNRLQPLVRALQLIGRMGQTRSRARGAVALVLVMLAATALVAAPGKRVNALAATLQQFHERVDAYRKLRARVVGSIGALPKTDDPAAITERQHALGDGIRRARADARQGDIFTPPVARVIRRFVARDLARRRPVDRRAFVVEQPDVRLAVNDFYPLSSVPLATVPPRLLKQLPTLDDGLEYRFVGSTLILRDVDANLVVDLLPGAIPARYRKH